MMNSFCHWLSAILVVTWDHAGVVSGGANRMQFGEAAVPVSCFVEQVGPVFVSVQNQQHVDLLGRGLQLSLFRPKRNCVVLVSATPSASFSSCGDVNISPVSKLSLPTSFAAPAHCFMLQAPPEGRRCERHSSHKPKRSLQGQPHCAC